MKQVRAVYKTRATKFLMPLLGVLFVFSVSIHSHKLNFSSDSLVKISGTSQEAGHSVEVCSACRLHGNIKFSAAVAVSSLIASGRSISYKETIYLTPYSFLLQDKPSRSPPAV